MTALQDDDPHKSADSLMRAEALQQAVLHSGSFSVIATDVNGIIQIFNVGAQRRLGYREADVVNKVTPAVFADQAELMERARELSAEFHTAIAPGFEVLSYQAAHGGEQVHRITGVRKDGVHFPAIVSVTALHDAEQQIIGYLLIGTDDAARHDADNRSQLDEQRRDQQFYTRSVIESSVDALITMTPAGIITDVNQHTITLLGRTRDELIGLPFRLCFLDPATADRLVHRVLAEDRVTDAELTVAASNGTQFRAACNAVVYRDRDRVVRGVFASVRDVTALRPGQTPDPHAAESTGSPEASTSLPHVARELGPPLTSILEFSEVLKDGILGELSDQQRATADAIFTSGQHLVNMLNDLINLAHLQTGTVPLAVVDVHVESLLYMSLVRLREQAADPTVGFDVSVSDEAYTFPLDVQVTMQILLNVLANAVRASASGSRVSLSATLVPRAAVGTITGPWPVHALPLVSPSTDDFLQISVQDAGTGIPPQQLPNLFEPFPVVTGEPGRAAPRQPERDGMEPTRFEPKRWQPNRFENSGLGLAVVKDLTVYYGGTVAVASSLGEGTRFVVWLRRRPVQKAAADTTSGDTTSGEATDAAPAATSSASLPSDHLTAPTAIPSPAAVPTPASVSFSPPSPPVLVPAPEPADSAFTEDSLTRHLPQHSRIALVIESDAPTTEWLRLLLAAEGFTVVHAADGDRGLELATRLPVSLITLDVLLPGIDGWGLLARLRTWPELNRIPVVVIAGLVDMSFALSQGATAVLEKPITRADLRQSLNLLGLRTAHARATNILVLDDRETTAKLVAAHLKPPHFQVAYLGSGAGAQAVAQKLQPDLIILNLLMDNQTGFAVVRALQGDPVTERIPLLVMSAAPLTRDERDALQDHPAQPVRLIMTPDFDPVEFITEVKNAIS
ncbi:response regulator [Cryobacterium melibiosiphilum]|uniref:histidine kinase n=1 Tax=Cryobacterium melibiosiphilum TaxID=995039 RepID=A0A3A5MPL7_9MICO|nr:response regulator [Cryobacterium melibiosiphilum]RJT88903.1 response regulator [Cryobacterium melibiosiphilum]